MPEYAGLLGIDGFSVGVAKATRNPAEKVERATQKYGALKSVKS